MSASLPLLKIEVETAAIDAVKEALTEADALFIFTEGTGEVNQGKGRKLIDSLKIYGANKLSDLSAGGTQAKELARARTALETLLAFCLTPENTEVDDLAAALKRNESLAQMYAKKLIAAMDPKITQLYKTYLKSATYPR